MNRIGQAGRRYNTGLARPALRVEPLEDRRLLAVTPQQILEINFGHDGSLPSMVVEAGGVNYFLADDGVHGSELWRTDGTAAGTQLVKDINPGSGGSAPDDNNVHFASMGGKLYFWANDGTHGFELWKSDGSEAGTTLVRDIWAGSSSSGPHEMFATDDQLFFLANDSAHNTELWQSDGTTAGTSLLKEIRPGTSGAFFNEPAHFTEFNGNVYFEAEVDQLWKTDGTTNGTVLVKNFQLGNDGELGNELVELNGALYFAAEGATADGIELWKTDGTTAGTVLVKNIAVGTADSSPQGFVKIDDTLFFAANGTGVGRELWKSDGTAAGTVVVKDIRPNTNPSNQSSDPKLLTDVDGTLYFTATDGTTGTELWKSDGTEVGTVLVKDLTAGNLSSSLAGLSNLDGTLVFTFGSGNKALWKSDGTSAGTIAVAPAIPNVVNVSIAGGEVYFRTSDVNIGDELWASDLTTAGTRLVKDINVLGAVAGSNPIGFTDVAGTTYFVADGDNQSQDLWKTDGTAAGSSVVKNFPGFGSIRESVNLNGQLLFVATDGVHGKELWTSDGTEAGTTMIRDIVPGAGEPTIADLKVYNGKAYFTARDGTNGSVRSFWVTDGTEAGTIKLNGNGVDASVSMGGFVYFITRANSPISYPTLWKTDGTTAGTVPVKQFTSAPVASSSIVELNGSLYFTASTDDFDDVLWKSDGTSAGTIPFIGGTGNNLPPLGLTKANDKIFYRTVTSSVFNIWVTDGTQSGTTLLMTLQGRTSESFESAVAGGKYFFSLNSQTYKRELFASDGTVSGTGLVKDIQPEDAGVAGLRVVNDAVFFSANDGTGQKLWTSDGTAAGTVVVSNTAGSRLTEVAGSLYLMQNGEPALLRSPAVSVDLDGTVPSQNAKRSWDQTPIAMVHPTATLNAAGANIVSLTARLLDPRAGDVLAAVVTGTAISSSFDGTTLTLWGEDTLEHYEQVLRSITFDSLGGYDSAKIEVRALNTSGWSAVPVYSTIAIELAPQVDLNGETAGRDSATSWLGVPGTLPASQATITSPSSPTLAALTVQIVNSEIGDVLSAVTAGTNIVASFDGTILLLSGADTVANYQSVLRSVAYNYTGASPTFASKQVRFAATDSTGLTGPSSVATVSFPLRVDLNGPWGPTSFSTTWNGPPVAIAHAAASLLVAGSTPLTAMYVEIVGLEAFDVLAANTAGTNITAAFNGGILTLSGSDTRTNYEQVLRSVTYDGRTPAAFAKEIRVRIRDGLGNLSAAATSTVSITWNSFVQPIKDIVPGAVGSNSRNYVDVNGLAYFIADDGVHGEELWKSDGTAAGTVLVKDIRSGGIGASIAQMVDVNGTLMFTADAGAGEGLWKSDGTLAGTELVRAGAINSLVNVNGLLYFVSGDELWKSNGTTAGTALVKDFNFSLPLVLYKSTAVGDLLFMALDDGVHGVELWKSDGTDAGTSLVKDIHPGSDSAFFTAGGSVPEMIEMNGELYFVAEDQVTLHIWRSNGTEAGTTIYVPGDFTPSYTRRPEQITNVNGTLFWVGFEVEIGVELFRGGSLVANIAKAPEAHSFPKELTAVGDKLYFTADDGEGSDGRDLWVIDSAGTGLTQLFEQRVESLTAVGDTLFFTADNWFTGNELWHSNGTLAGTGLIDVRPGEVSSNPSNLADVGGSLFFTAGGPLGAEPYLVRLPTAATAVAARHVFYNNSKFDGNNPAANAADDGAIASDKVPLLPGQGQATGGQVTSYSRGINGIMIDIFDAPGDLSLADFTFRMGATNSIGDWAQAPAPLSLTVRAGAGAGGSDRVTIVWADGAIKNTWLEVTVEGNDVAGGFNTSTGLATSDVFYWGNRIADSGLIPGASTFVTASTDSSQVFARLGNNRPITDQYDYNRDGRVDTSDSFLVFANLGSLVRLDLGSAAPAAQPLISPAEPSGVAFALAVDQAVHETVGPVAAPLGALEKPAAPLKNPLGHGLNAIPVRPFDHMDDVEHPLSDVTDDLLDLLVGRDRTLRPQLRSLPSRVTA